MPWTCSECKIDVPDAQWECPECGADQSSWSVSADAVASISLSRKRFLSAEVGDGDLPVADASAYATATQVDCEVAWALDLGSVRAYTARGELPPSDQVCFVHGEPRKGQASDVRVAILYADGEPAVIDLPLDHDIKGHKGMESHVLFVWDTGGEAIDLPDGVRAVDVSEGTGCAPAIELRQGKKQTLRVELRRRGSLIVRYQDGEEPTSGEQVRLSWSDGEQRRCPESVGDGWQCAFESLDTTQRFTLHVEPGADAAYLVFRDVTYAQLAGEEEIDWAGEQEEADEEHEAAQEAAGHIDDDPPEDDDGHDDEDDDDEDRAQAAAEDDEDDVDDLDERLTVVEHHPAGAA